MGLLQGVLFGLLFNSANDTTADSGGTGALVAGVLLVVAVLLLVSAVRQLIADDDPDAPPPKWMTMTATMRPLRAFLVGVGVLAVGTKFWVFTLTGVGAISDADLSRGASIGIFVLLWSLCSRYIYWSSAPLSSRRSVQRSCSTARQSGCACTVGSS